MTGLSTNERTLLDDVIDELSYDPKIDAHNIAVVTEGDIVSLAGTVNSFAEKRAAERATLRVRGVRGVANELTIKAIGAPPSDMDIAQAAEIAVLWNTLVPKGAVQVIVRRGHVTLQGNVQWQYQREAAHRAISHLAGVHGVVNLISIPLYVVKGLYPTAGLYGVFLVLAIAGLVEWRKAERREALIQ